MTIKHLFGIWEDRVPIEIQNEIEKQLHEMKMCADPDWDMSRSATICYHLVNFIRKNVENRVCRILLLIEVLDWARKCGLSFYKELYREVELLILVVDEPVRDVLTNFLKEI